MTDAEALKALAEKREEITAYISTALGMGAPADLSDVDRDRLDGETDDAIEAWDGVVGELSAPVPAKGDLQQLLTEYRRIEDAVIDVRAGRLTRNDKNFGRDDEA
ncbi:hypothetical protein FPV16_19230 [Methylobacterium sp. W2]|uniref:hypothetical protein n=1 Tax=Methylobacterium sp. W2 TaxID=2598107 RepID=UPI001D0C743E|nr:hypothetical protein [Methylobacterium sp. W2]MCC0808316.1 hypothetical protein [Methylobacterium sp. W2]